MSRVAVHASLLFLLALFANFAAADAGNSPRDSPRNDIEVKVVLDTAEQTGSATAAVRIHAQRETVWSLITSCAEALHLVPGLTGCQVLETAPDQSWQRIRHVLDYSWYVPKLTYEIRATYDRPARVSIERISGDLSIMHSSWALQIDGDYTIAHYAVDLAPGFWVPHWLVRAALKRDLPTMLRALRARAEFVQNHPG
jgi:hypothetical protein